MPPPNPDHRRRAHEQMRRLLTMIDMLAAQVQPKTLAEIRALLPDDNVCLRTIQRDVDLLESMGLVRHAGSGQARTAKGSAPRAYELDLPRSERLQAAAMLVHNRG